MVTVAYGFENTSRPSRSRATERVSASSPSPGAIGACTNVPAPTGATTLRLRPMISRMLVRTRCSSLSQPRLLEMEIQSSLEDVCRVVVAVEIALPVEPQPRPPHERVGRREGLHVHLDRGSKQVRGQLVHAVVARQVAADAGRGRVLVAKKAGRGLGVVAVLVAHRHAVRDVLVHAAAELVRGDAPVVVVEPVAE